MDIKENKLLLSQEAKYQYLDKLIGKMIKILHLIEEEKDTHISPSSFIWGQLVELNSANQLFEGSLVDLIVKLNIVYNSYQTEDFKKIKKQIFEIKNKILYLRDNLGRC